MSRKNGRHDKEQLEQIESQLRLRHPAGDKLLHDLKHTRPHADQNFETGLENQLIAQLQAQSTETEEALPMIDLIHPTIAVQKPVMKRTIPLTLVVALTVLILGISAIVSLYSRPQGNDPYGAVLQVTATATFDNCLSDIEWNAVYIIEEGDTLNSVANQFNITLEQLLEANCQLDSTTIIVGYMLRIPLMGVVTSVQLVNLREGPNTDYSAFAAVNAGTNVVILSQNEDGTWYYVELPTGERGWITSRLVEINSDVILMPTPNIEIILQTATALAQSVSEVQTLIATNEFGDPSESTIPPAFLTATQVLTEATRMPVLPTSTPNATSNSPAFLTATQIVQEATYQSATLTATYAPTPEPETTIFDFVNGGSVTPLGCESENALFTGFGWDADGNLARFEGTAFGDDFGSYTIEIAPYDESEATEFTLLFEGDEAVTTSDILAEIDFSDYFENSGLYRLWLSVLNTESNVQSACEVIIETNEINSGGWVPVSPNNNALTFGLSEYIASFDTPNNPFEVGDRIDILAGFLFVDVDSEFQQPLSMNSTVTNNTQGTWILDNPYDLTNENSAPQFMIQRVISDVEIVEIGSSIPPISIYNDDPEEFIMLAVSSQDVEILTYLIDAQIPLALMYTAEIND